VRHQLWAGRSTSIAGTVRLLLLVVSSLMLQEQLVLAEGCSSKPTAEVVIVIDVGHVPRQQGEQCHRGITCPWGETSARGIPEYDFNLNLAKRINQELVRQGFGSTQLLLTPAGGTLRQRADRANAVNADIFLSIHHDGVRDEAMKPWTFNGEPQYYFDASRGFSLHISPRNPRYNESLELARIIADRLMARGLQFTRIHDQNHVEGARVPWADKARGIYSRRDVFVLGAANMPAVLLEGGVIVNREEEPALSSPAYQLRIASAVTEAIKDFCRPRDVVE